MSHQYMNVCSFTWYRLFIFQNVYVYTNTYMHAITISENKKTEFERVGRDIWKGLEGEKGGRNVM